MSCKRDQREDDSTERPKKKIKTSNIHFEVCYDEVEIFDYIKNRRYFIFPTTFNCLNLKAQGDAPKLGDEGSKYISKLLKLNTTITKLNLKDNNIQSEGAKHIAKLLQRNSTIKELILSRNCIGTAGAQYISEALKINSTLTFLKLALNQLRSSDLCFLSNSIKINTTLLSLDISENRLRSTDPYPIANLFLNSSLTFLSLYGNDFGGPIENEIFTSLSKNLRIKYLNLGANNISNEDMPFLSKALQHNTSLLELNLCENSMSNHGLVFIGELLLTNSTLTALNLHRNPNLGMQEEQLTIFGKHLENNSTLKKLILTDCSIGAALIDSLQKNHGITYLDTSESLFTIENIAHILMSNSTLTHLIAKCSWPSLKEICYLTLSTALKVNSTITHLDLESSLGMSTDEGTRYISEGVAVNSSITYLNLSRNKIKNAQYISLMIEGNSTLKELDLSCNDIDYDGFSLITNAMHTNSTLTSLNLLNNSIEEDDETSLKVIKLLENNNTLQNFLLDESQSDEDCVLETQALINVTMISNKRVTSWPLLHLTFPEHYQEQLEEVLLVFRLFTISQDLSIYATRVIISVIEHEFLEDIKNEFYTDTSSSDEEEHLT